MDETLNEIRNKMDYFNIGTTVSLHVYYDDILYLLTKIDELERKLLNEALDNKQLQSKLKKAEKVIEVAKDLSDQVDSVWAKSSYEHKLLNQFYQALKKYLGGGEVK